MEQMCIRDREGVGKLIDMAATLGRKTRSDLELGILSLIHILKNLTDLLKIMTKR